MSRWIVRYAYAPIMLIGVNALTLDLVTRGASWWWLLALGLAAVFLTFVAELAAPLRRAWNVSIGDEARDWLHVVVGQGMTVASIAIATILPPRADVLWPSTWPPVMQWLLALLIFDLSVTLVHAASHRWSGLWRFHAVHHGAQRLYGLNGLARHPVHQVIETIGGSVPLMVLGMPPWVGAVLAMSVAVQLLMQHGNVDYRLGALARWLSCNRAHRLHHRADADGDVNFGLFFLVWDRLLGTYRWEDSEPAHDARRLGVADRPDFPIAYWDQLIDPFRARPPTAARLDLDSSRNVGETSA